MKSKTPIDKESTEAPTLSPNASPETPATARSTVQAGSTETPEEKAEQKRGDVLDWLLDYNKQGVMNRDRSEVL